MKAPDVPKSRLVSIIIPTHNRDWCLRRAIESALGQSHADCEVVVVDNCSDDLTPELVGSIQDARLRYYRQANLVSPYENYSKGLDLSHGEFVAFLPDDDWLRAEFIAARLPHMARSARVAAVFGGRDEYDESGRRVACRASVGVPGALLTSLSALQAVLRKDWLIFSTLYRRSSISGLWPDLKNDGLVFDFGLNIRLAIGGTPSIVEIDGSDYVVTLHPDQSSCVQMEEVLIDAGSVLERLMAHAPDVAQRRLIARELACSRVVLGRHMASRSRLALGRAYLWRAVLADPLASWPWRQLLLSVLHPKRVSGLPGARSDAA